MSTPFPPLDKAPCRQCRNHVTWTEQRRQYARMVQRGKTPDEAKALSPRCPKCTTAALHGRLEWHR
jgi:endogenous inhibitor of DNA gyrase (YacG/DUF329 family)